jgi:secreted trypsin-like serine protease
VAVRLGEHDISTEKDCNSQNSCAPPVQDIQIELALKHKDFDNSKKINDIALLRLKTAADVTKRNVKTICLPTTADVQIEKVEKSLREKMLISGWGRVESGDPSDVLMKAYIPYITNAECSQKFSSFNIPIHDTYMCAGGKNKTDTCNGDSG